MRATFSGATPSARRRRATACDGANTRSIDPYSQPTSLARMVPTIGSPVMRVPYSGRSVWYWPTTGRQMVRAASRPSAPIGPGVETCTRSIC